MSFNRKTGYYSRVLTRSYLQYNLTPPLIGPLQEPKVVTVYPEDVKIAPKKQAEPMGKVHDNFEGIVAAVDKFRREVKWVEGDWDRVCTGEAERWWECYYCWLVMVDNWHQPYHYRQACSHCQGWRKREMDLAWADVMRSELPKGSEWSWFITWSFRDPAPWAQKLGWTQVGWKYALTAWKAFLVWMQHHLHEYNLEYYGWKYFMVLENQERGVPHIHALFWSEATEDDPRFNDDLLGEARKYLWERGGFNKVYKYDKKLGAELYLSNYVTKEMLYWETSRDSMPETFIPCEEDLGLALYQPRQLRKWRWYNLEES